MDRPGTWEIPRSPHANADWVHGTTTDQACTQDLHRAGAKLEETCGAGSRSHKWAGADAGSRSVLVVLTTSGNSVREDPIEGRGTPWEQNRIWETRRAH